MGAALLLSRVMQALIFGVSPSDAVTYVVVATLVLLAAALASYVPARRATLMDPMVALRHE